VTMPAVVSGAQQDATYGTASCDAEEQAITRATGHLLWALWILLREARTRRSTSLAAAHTVDLASSLHYEVVIERPLAGYLEVRQGTISP
jgi:hypothetical protein